MGFKYDLKLERFSDLNDRPGRRRTGLLQGQRIQEMTTMVNVHRAGADRCGPYLQVSATVVVAWANGHECGRQTTKSVRLHTDLREGPFISTRPVLNENAAR